MTREKKLSKEHQLLEAARLGQYEQLEHIFNQLQLKAKRRTNPLSSLRKIVGPNSVRDPTTGFTCLHHAALNGHSECVQLILNNGAKLNAVDYKGSSALHLASWAGNIQVVRILLQRSAESSAALGQQQCAASSFESRTKKRSRWQQSDSGSPSGGGGGGGAADEQQQQQHEFCELYDQFGAANEFNQLDVNLCNNDNQTPLLLAAQFGHNEVVSELIRHSADVHIRNNQLESALDLACLNGRLETAALLLESSPSQLQVELRLPRACVRRSTLSKQQLHSCAASQSSAGGRTKSFSGAQLVGLQSAELQNGGGGGGWSTLLSRGSTATSSRPNLKAAGLQNSSLDLSSTSELAHDSPDDEILLDHSPLHYAIRRGHLALARLLLDKYQANIMLLSGRGSVLHEIAHNYCDKNTIINSNEVCGDMMQLIFDHLNRRAHKQHQLMCSKFDAAAAAANPIKWHQQIVESFLSLRNNQNKSALDILDKLNTRRAQEIKLMINKFLDTSTSQPTKPQMPVDYNHDNNSRHINSFVTMKRRPKTSSNAASHRDQAAADSSARVLHETQLNNLLDFARGSSQSSGQFAGQAATQTLNRRRLPMEVGGHPNSVAAQLGGAPNVDMQQQQQQQQMQLQQISYNQWAMPPVVPPFAMTRSTSNISGRQHFGRAPNFLRLYPNPAISPGSFQSFDSTHNQQHLQFQPAEELRKSAEKSHRQKRSKSRELGSLLMEAHATDHLNDHQPNGSNEQSDLFQHPTESSHYSLVRSRTDCSHLMGRLCAAENLGQTYANKLTTSESTNSARSFDQAFAADDQQHYRRLNQTSTNNQLKLQQYATIDRRAINRGYHVYEREFYPPRLLQPAHTNQPTEMMGCGNGKQKQSVAIVPPLERMASDQANRHSSSSSFDSPNLARHSRNSMSKSRHQQTAATVDSQNDGINAVTNNRIDSGAGASRHGQQAQSQSSRRAIEPPQTFESTRMAIMRDFDQMIAGELLNMTNKSTHDESGASTTMATHQRLQKPILTGVELAMDPRGECLTVSATRVTAHPVEDQQQPTSADQMSADQHRHRWAFASNDSSGASSSVSFSGQQKPEKPPKPSIRSKELFKIKHRQSSVEVSTSQRAESMDGAQNRRASVIYDMPEVCQQSDTEQRAQQVAMSAHDGSRCQQQLRTMSPQSTTAPKSKQNVISITKPPKERPPPPPPLAAQRMSQKRLDGMQSVDGSGGQKHSLTSPESSLVSPSPRSSEKAPAPTESSCDSGSVSCWLHSSAGLPPETDSGICTSNSPATSISHDSESQTTKSNDNSENSDPQVAEQNDGSSSIPPPPSPTTAQQFIEEALRPLDKNMTCEVANQTSCSKRRRRIEKSSLSSRRASSTANIICDWLDSTRPTKSFADDTDRKLNKSLRGGSGDYENCIMLQHKLARLRSLNNLNLNIDTTTRRSIADLREHLDFGRVEMSDHEDEDDDYANTTDNSLTHYGADSFEALYFAPPAGHSSERQKPSADRVDVLEVKMETKTDDHKLSVERKHPYDHPDLEQISAETPNGSCEVESMTDEELHASVDKSSGCIRFTLTKRRNSNVSETNQFERQGEISNVSPQTREDSNISQGLALENIQSNGELPNATQRQASIGAKESAFDPEMSPIEVSDSSKDSVKSILSPTNVIHNQDLSDLPSEKERTKSAEIPNDLESQRSISSGTEINQTKPNTPKPTDTSMPVEQPIERCQPRRSVVSETVRRLEAAAAQNSTLYQREKFRPTAAVRQTKLMEQKFKLTQGIGKAQN